MKASTDSENKKPKAKKNGGITIVLLLVCAILVGAGIYLTMLNNKTKALEETTTSVDSKDELNRILEVTLARDMEMNYPSSPEDVVQFYGDTARLLYDGGITDEETIKSIMLKQRKVYDKQLLDLNTFEQQYEAFSLMITNYAALNISIASFEVVSVVYDENEETLCTAQVIQQMMGESDLYFNFYFQRNELGQWKIILLEPTDANFL